jgi:transcriptional regulator with XRE-family HTH domain
MNASKKVSNIAITHSQVRAARALIGWTLDQLEAASGLPKRTLTRFENETTAPRAATIAAIRTALEAAGVLFIDENGEGPGVRLRKEKS